MAIIASKPLDINKFWEKTPQPLKYLLLISLIVGASYFLVSRKVDVNQVKELTKIEAGIEVTYDLVQRFEAYQLSQSDYNKQVIEDISNIYTLITELNISVNRKFDYLIENGGDNNKDLLDKLDLLNESFDKLSKAYQPKEKPELPEPSISVKKIENKND